MTRPTKRAAPKRARVAREVWLIEEIGGHLTHICPEDTREDAKRKAEMLTDRVGGTGYRYRPVRFIEVLPPKRKGAGR